MNRILFVSVLTFFFLDSMASAQELSRPPVADHEHGIYRTIIKKSKKIIWQAEWFLNKEILENQDNSIKNITIVRVEESGYGKYKNAENPITWKMESTFTLEDPPKVLNTIKAAIAKDGKESWRKSKIFDYSNKKLIAEEFFFGELTREKGLALPDGITFPTDILAILLRGYNFDRRSAARFYIFSVDAKLYKIRAELNKTEEVKVLAGTFLCYKIELMLDVVIFNMTIGHFLPKTYMWFTVDEPHIWIKYEGLESGFGSPYVVMELVKFDKR